MRNIILLALITLTSCTGQRAASQVVKAKSQQPVAAISQSNPADRVAAPFSDPSKPGRLQVHLLSGTIGVRAYNGKEVIVNAEGQDGERDRDSRSFDSMGLRRLRPSYGFRVEEKDNVMVVAAGLSHSGLRLDIQVPAKTDLNLSSVNGGDIEVEGVEGEIVIRNTNGSVRAHNVSGSVVAHSANGGVFVTLRQVTPGKPLSFTTFNGTVDVTVPPTIKANAKMRSNRGEIWSDIDIKVTPATTNVVEDSRSTGGRYRLRIDDTVNGTINGGGPDLTLTSTNGNIYFRSGK